MPINLNTKGIATIWLIIAGFVLIAGGGVYWLGTKSPKPMSDLEWFVKDEERLNRDMDQGGNKNMPSNGNTEPDKQQIEKPQTENQKIDTSTWKTYRNEKYGFLVKYPGEWELSENGLPHNSNYFITLKNIQEQFDVHLFIKENSERLNAKDYALKIFEDFEKTGIGGVKIIDKFYINLENILAYEVEILADEELSEEIYITNQDYAYKFSIPAVLENQPYIEYVRANNKISHQILSTFKFFEVMTLPIVDTSSWLEYKNDQYGFKIKYPFDWVWKNLSSNNQHLANDAMIGFAPKSFGGVDFEVLIQVNKRGLDANANKISSQLNENTALVSVSDILFKGISGKKIIFKNKTTKSNSTMIVLSGQGNLSYIISLPTEDDFRIFSTLDFF